MIQSASILMIPLLKDPTHKIELLHFHSLSFSNINNKKEKKTLLFQWLYFAFYAAFLVGFLGYQFF